MIVREKNEERMTSRVWLNSLGDGYQLLDYEWQREKGLRAKLRSFLLGQIKYEMCINYANGEGSCMYASEAHERGLC